jgi:hypothetical protein
MSDEGSIIETNEIFVNRQKIVVLQFSKQKTFNSFVDNFENCIVVTDHFRVHC